MEFETIEIASGDVKTCWLNIKQIVKIEKVRYAHEPVTRVWPTQGDFLDVKMELTELVKKINAAKAA